MVPMTIPVTGEQYAITAGDYAATITQLGAGLRELTFRGEPAVAGYPAAELPPGAAGQLLIPWPNRVDGGRYEVGGHSYQLDLNEPARSNAIHGLTRWMSWNVLQRAPSEVTLGLWLLGRPGYPFCLEIEARYRVGANDGLQVRVTAHNRGPQRAPYGTGSHPYLTVGEPVDGCELALPCSLWQPANDRGIPAGPARAVDGGEMDFRQARQIGATELDHAFTGLTRGPGGRTWARLLGQRSQVSLWAGEGYQWLQAFTADTLSQSRRRQAVAIEPMTCPPNAFVSGTDLIMLEPGDGVTHEWGIEVSNRG